MTNEDFESCWQELCKLWPSWHTNRSLYESWGRIFRPLSRDAVLSAIQEHWEAAGAAFQPNPKDIKKLAAMNHQETRSPQEAEHIRRWERTSKLGQCEYAARSYAAMAMRAEGGEAARLREKADMYAANAKRLRALHGDDCPPNYGPDTRMPEPDGPKHRGRAGVKIPTAVNLDAIAAQGIAGVPFENESKQ